MKSKYIYLSRKAHIFYIECCETWGRVYITINLADSYDQYDSM